MGRSLLLETHFTRPRPIWDRAGAWRWKCVDYQRKSDNCDDKCCTQDAVVLAQTLAGVWQNDANAVHSALRGYEGARMARAAPLVQRAYFMGAALGLSFWPVRWGVGHDGCWVILTTRRCCRYESWLCPMYSVRASISRTLRLIVATYKTWRQSVGDDDGLRWSISLHKHSAIFLVMHMRWWCQDKRADDDVPFSEGVAVASFSPRTTHLSSVTSSFVHCLCCTAR